MAKRKQKRIGRPPSKNPRCEVVRFKVTAWELDALEAACEAAEMTRTDLIRKRLARDLAAPR